MHRPLLVTDDHELLDDVLGIAAELPLDLDVETGPERARGRFASAPIVLIGDAVAPACVRAGLPRRAGVLLLTRGRVADRVRVLAEAVGADHIVPIPDGAGLLLDRLAGLVDAQRGRILAVLGGRGGAGASILAAGLAVTAGGAGLRSLLVDADPLGGGVDLALGWDDAARLRLGDGLPGRGAVGVLSCDRAPAGTGLTSDAMAAALDIGSRARDLVVADLPRRLDDAAVLALRAADRVLLVVPAELRACVAASRVAATVAPHTDALHLVVRHPGPGGLRTRQIAQSLGLPVAGSLRAEPDLPRRIEAGDPPTGSGRGPLASLCRRILDDLGLATGVAA
ncbi:septum site-determining protein Ssd [Dactylosporangium sp. NPDC005572]|uniref:septum site-determining protein Ssd n=1 Tax=Dactylosporangium sp. NPDC005572 TaxID=3156889 RepID=UPI0033A25B20